MRSYTLINKSICYRDTEFSDWTYSCEEPCIRVCSKLDSTDQKRETINLRTHAKNGSASQTEVVFTYKQIHTHKEFAALPTQVLTFSAVYKVSFTFELNKFDKVQC